MISNADQKDPRCETGVEGLDEVLAGGFPSHRLYLIEGDPGVGKTTLALQFLLEGVRQNERGLYITLSETREELEAVARSHRWNLEPLDLFELSSIQGALRGETESTFFHPSDVELDRTTQAMLAEVERVNPQRVVFDSLSELRMLAETPLRFRRQILRLKQYFAGRKCTILVLDDRSAGAQDLQVESIAHGVLDLQRLSPTYGVARRQLNVRKIRGVKFREGNHDLILNTGGMVIFPRLVAAEHHADFRRDPFPSGVTMLDLQLGGGLDWGTSNMFMGPPGTGKSTLALQFIHAAAEKGRKSYFLTFDETLGTLMSRAAQLGLDLSKHVESGMVRIDQVDPAEISPGELAYRLQNAVAKGVEMVAIDSINGYLNATPEERFLTLQLHELLAFLNQQGVITIMVLAQQGLMGVMQSGVDLTYLADTVVLLRYFESRGEIRQLRIGPDGIWVGEPLYEMHGVFSGIPKFTEDDGGEGPLDMRGA